MTGTTLVGRIVAVTGGAQGIGREIARQLAEAGALVAIGDRDAQAAEATAQALPGQVRAFALDVTDTGSFRRFLAQVTDAWGPLDVLVNNAGVMWVGPFDNEPETATERMLAVNLHGVIRGVRLVAPPMRDRGSGHIVTVASAASKLAPPGESTYAATKHGVLGYLTGVREELRGSGVEVSVIMPGVVDTELAIGTDSGATARLQPGDVAAAVVKVLRQPRFEVTLPASIGLLVRITGLLPQSLRDQVLRRTVPNQVVAAQRSSARESYEHRALTETPDPRKNR
ncbi:SDR family oxidoreductase [Nocardia cyriacigeorgica]|uniref:SDR family oxidoreductase n=1 Tax=Nocardia cyriacigeorgica TaxID=135487 RepID=UPI0018947078|nr:SDR family oxidoreductase [Nocardia cyriacigeorgica]MBF6399221.1 SDR family oxidoreductase [Nocardia cyriacigeorgica]MBF6404852.1 SDR family oxidoreductase [Nocardia cyriacigeorgica]